MINSHIMYEESKVPEGKIFILVSKRVMLEVQKDVDEPGPPHFLSCKY